MTHIHPSYRWISTTTTTSSFLFIVGLLVFGFLSKAHAVLFVEDFDNGVLDPNLAVSASSGFSFTESGGMGNVTKAGGTGNGHLYLSTNFQVLGDFTASVEATRTDLSSNGEMGLETIHPSLGFTDVFFYSSSEIISNIVVSPGFGSQSVGNSSPSVVFQIRRVGNTIFEEFDSGSGFQALHSATHGNLAGPTTIELFLVQEYGNTAAHNGTFDNFTIYYG